MCGIAGYFVKRPSPAPGPPIPGLLAAVAPRGPDDEGVALVDRRSRTVRSCRGERTTARLAALPHHSHDVAPHDVALLCARFAIIDPSPGGHQPFVSADGSVVAVVNGEIYNFLELREELSRAGVGFRTASDTEVLVEGYRAWGDDLWARLNGFWALALYDARSDTVVLARDRFGVAPLYARESGDGIVFASSIGAVLAGGAAAPDRDAVSGFLATGLKDFGAATCFEGIRHVPPATALRFGSGQWNFAAARRVSFWRPPERRHATGEVPLGEAVRRFRDLFMDAVALRLRADAPIACELSGGLDSSCIAAACASLGRPLPAYTVVSDGARDPLYAREVATRWTLETRLIPSPERGFFEEAEWFTRAMEEPYHSPNIYAHYRVRREVAGDGVRVILGGSGGDEVLAGYFHDFWPAAYRAMRDGGGSLQAWIGALIRRAGALRARAAGAQAPVPGGASSLVAGDGRTTAERLDASYRELDFDERVRYHLTVGLLPYYLSSNDHFTMAIPVEHRFPFLDHRLVDLALSLPVSYLFRNGWTKYVLRKAMEPMLPRAVVWRRGKEGFPFPLRKFLEANRSALAPQLDVLQRADLGLHSARDYDVLLGHPPGLWRACSTGLWLTRMAPQV